MLSFAQLFVIVCLLSLACSLKVDQVLEDYQENGLKPDLECSNTFAVGYSISQDILVDGQQFFTKYLETLETPNEYTPKSHDQINSQTDFLESVLYYFENGGFPYFYVSNKELITSIDNLLQEIQEKTETMGGNPFYLADVLARHGCSTLLGTESNSRIKSKLPEKIDTLDLCYVLQGTTMNDLEIIEKVNENANSNENENENENEMEKENTSDLENQEEQTKPIKRIVFQFQQGQSLLSYSSKSESRIMITWDKAAIALPNMEDLHSHVNELQPTVFSFGGFPVADKATEGVQQERMREIKMFLEGLPQKVSVHFDMSTHWTNSFTDSFMDDFFPLIDSIALNHQSFKSIVAALDWPPHVMDEFSKQSPSSQLLHRMMMQLLSPATQSEQESGRSGLSKIHFQAKGFNMLGFLWKYWDKPSLMDSLIKSSIEPALFGCAQSEQELINSISQSAEHQFECLLEEKELKNMINYNQKYKILKSYGIKDYNFFIAPRISCKNQAKKLGFEEAVSAASLAYSKRN
ncbi:adp-dependent glucokinase [Anaeramoeba flamelloides]|uniref:Adp-dependent glucokinase n=1 Tax=Anaeramoeba flamelloides TaxID=1746091 RepID=A0ABQ8YZ83_9EUKA|nr:adp-dependent glucokinase [Anaeramoeba flamelloides]